MKKTMLMFFIFATAFLSAQLITFEAMDNPNDDGNAILLKWDISAVSSAIATIELIEESGDTILIQKLTKPAGSFTDGQNIKPKIEYQYLLTVYNADGEILESASSFAVPRAQWFNTNKISLLIMALILTIAIVYYICSARSGKKLYIRKIAGLESIDESVGRATEMGKPILFVPGILDLDDMQTIAGLTFLGKLAQKTAEYDAELIVPVCRSMVLSTAKEIVKEAYLKAGRPDAHKPDSVFYLTDDQFGYVAGVDGIIIREKPAANFFIGAFYAESLILAETGFAHGAIQTAGTAMPSQLPFFVVACDYTLIGEELFAASAYLSKDPHQLGSLKGQDLGKAIFVITLTIGVILEIFGINFLKDFLTLH